LRRHIHYIRQTLPPGEWILSDRAAVQWNLNTAWRLDVADFEQQSRVAALRAAATKLYAGDLYKSCDEEWLYFERERLRNVQLANLSALAHEAERLRDPAGAAAHAQTLLMVDPWREDALRILMRARMQNGDRAGALAEYERFRARLLDDMGVEPMHETVALYEAFSRERQLAAPPQSPQSRALVGRDSERDALLRLWRAAAAARGGLVSIHGPVVTQLANLSTDDQRSLYERLETPGPALLLDGLEEIIPGRARGPLLGGNLELFSRLVGTPYLPDLAGAILFFEDLGERPYRIDRLITHLDLAGVFSAASAVILGDFSSCREPEATRAESPTAEEVLVERFGRLPIPVVPGGAFGHGTRNVALPYGALVELDTRTGTLVTPEGAVS